MSEEVNKIFEQWKQFLSWCYENNDKTTEIHRDNLEKVMEYTEKLETQLQQKENIIKEVREYIKTKYIAQGVLISYEVNNLLYELENILKGSESNE